MEGLSGARRADLAAVVLAVALALFGARYHGIESTDSAERDGFVAHAETLLRGELPADSYRPLLYPLLTAALAALGLPAFAAARLLSNLAAALLARSAYALGARLDPRAPQDGVSATGAWAMALAAANPNLWIHGEQVTTDMSFAAVTAGALVVLVDYVGAPGRRRALALGALLGLAAFLRLSALFLLPGIALGFALATAPWRQRMADLARAAGLALLVLLPHFVLRTMNAGGPFHDENWKNLAFKLYADGDWSYFDRVPFESLAGVIAHDPARFLASGGEQLLRFARSGLAALLGGPFHALLALAGLAALLALARSRAAGLLAAGAVAYLGALALMFFTWIRFLLPGIPLAAAFAAAGVAVASDRLGNRPVARPFAVALLAGAVGALAFGTATRALPAFVLRHPWVELTALRSVEPAAPAGAALAGTAPFLGRHLRTPYVVIPAPAGPERGEPARYLERLEALLRAEGVRYLVVSELELAGRPPALLGPDPPAPWLRRLRTFDGAILWEVVAGGGAAGAFGNGVPPDAPAALSPGRPGLRR